MPYKISGTSSDNSRIYVLQNDSLVGYKDGNYGNYNVVFDSDTPSGITVVSENPNGEALAFGGLTAISTGDSSNITIPPGLTIKSFQRLSIVQASTGTQNNTIAAVDITKTILFYNGCTTASTTTTDNNVLIYLSGATTVQTKLSYMQPMTINFSLLEFESGITVQNGQTAMGGTTQKDTSILAVNLDRTIINHTGSLHASPTGPGWNLLRISLINSTTLRTNVDATTGANATVAWQVISFD